MKRADFLKTALASVVVFAMDPEDAPASATAPPPVDHPCDCVSPGAEIEWLCTCAGCGHPDCPCHAAMYGMGEWRT